MKRRAMCDLVEWKRSRDRKPLLVCEARRVGKTRLLKQFGEACYRNVVLLDLEAQLELRTIFQKTKNTRRIIELISGERIEPGETLLILDGIEHCPEALNALKYFRENAAEYHAAATGSYLGALHGAPRSYPVGMVNLLELRPLKFDEFLEAAYPDLVSSFERIGKDAPAEESLHRISQGNLRLQAREELRDTCISTLNVIPCVIWLKWYLIGIVSTKLHTTWFGAPSTEERF